MTENIPKRRGRPPINAEAPAQQQAPQPVPDDPQADAAPPKRRRRASVGGHALKLSAPVRPGHTRRWFNDNDNRIAQADELAYDFVHDPDAQSTDTGSRVSRLVGTKPNGEPLRAYLMETPDEFYAEGVAEKEAHNRQIDDAILAGVDSTGQLGAPKAETYGQGSIQRDR